MGLSRLFYFQYQSQGQQQELVLPFQDDWFPVNPILVAFGANLKRVRKKLQAYPHEMIVLLRTVLTNGCSVSTPTTMHNRN